MSVDDCVARAARRAIDAITDPDVLPINQCGRCSVCATAPRPIPPVQAPPRSWWPYVAAAAAGFAVAWGWSR